MKSPIKVLLAGVGLLIGVPLVAWSVTFLYWHFRIASALRIVDTPPPAVTDIRTASDIEEAQNTLNSAGCRSYPYFVGALASPRNPERLFEAFYLTFANTTPEQGQALDAPTQSAVTLLKEFGFTSNSSPQKYREYGERARRWWETSGSEFHHWWCVWTPNCRGARAGPRR